MRLPNYLPQNRVHYQHYFWLLIICLLAYWPLSFGIFSVKNDAIHYFLPYRFHISEALRNGEAPFWSPYIYLGNPIQGDMQSGAWNPVVWLFSVFGRYDITLFHYENLFYIFLGGAGMYKLSYRLVDHGQTAFLIGASYLLSGFMLGGQLINWLAAAAFLPFIIHYYLLFLKNSRNSEAVKTGIAVFFLFTAGYPSFFILTVYLLFTLFIIETLKRFNNKKAKPFAPAKFLLQHLLMFLVFAGLSLPAIISYIDLLPYYQRGGGTSFGESVTNAFEWQHLLTLIFPSTIKANDIVSYTDVTCRNIYIGLLPLLAIVVLPPKMNRRNMLLILLAILSLLFSVGDATPFRQFCFQFVPLMNTFRHPSQMRLFLIFALLLLAAPGVKKLLVEPLSPEITRKLKWVLWISAGVLLTITVIALTRSTLFNKLSAISSAGTRNFLKNSLESFSFNDSITINGIIQLIFIILFIIGFRKFIRLRILFSLFWLANILIMAELVLPASFVSKVSPAEINKLLHSSPKGFPADSLQGSLSYNSKNAYENFDITGLQTFYTKKIGISRITNTPAFLAQQDSFTRTTLLYDYISSLPVTYLADSLFYVNDTNRLSLPHHCTYAFSNENITSGECEGTKKVLIKKISANSFSLETETNAPSFLVLTQNYFHHWRVYTDGVPGKIIKTNLSFMGTAVPAGKHIVLFRFVPVNTITGMWIQLAVILSLLLAAFYKIFKSNKNKL